MSKNQLFRSITTTKLNITTHGNRVVKIIIKIIKPGLSNNDSSLCITHQTNRENERCQSSCTLAESQLQILEKVH